MSELKLDTHLLKDKSELCNTTRVLLDEITSVFAINCINPWSENEFDKDKCGLIPVELFVNVARQLGFVFTATESRALLRCFKQSKIDYLDIDYFVRILDNKIRLDSDIKVSKFANFREHFREGLQRYYNIIDCHNTGKIPVTDLKQMLSSFNEGEFDSNTLECLLKVSESRNKRIITADDFVNILMPIKDMEFFSLRAFEDVNLSENGN
ncbi:hypothetical protein BEWA_007790 [Theileria equi strain WA]|uniref:EF-hand domain-containing protein n=1 Tax=Theileria equi strain WA TaxID=1537102 RepID=L0B0M8_THEEQ|nr:hypothetical protein BEWA_007790 [Theileria equi strain WA]AFZ81370.1 hypothetical protein BEWA_007790 [Theileria equi strain WA]|eukprot:XP_004831036.1 hypothetical protein BEWA_007790 [Theileria equi strain WA]